MRWIDAFKLAENYYNKHGDLLIPSNYTVDGFSLGGWIGRQRRKYHAGVSPAAEQIVPPTSEQSFPQNPKQIAALNPEESSSLNPKHIVPLTPDQIAALESIGMVWDLQDYAWESAFAVAMDYYIKHGNLTVSKDYEQDGVNLSHWIWAQRRIYAGTSSETGRKLTEEQVKRLESIGMEWAPKSKGFSYYYEQCRRFYEAYGHTDFPKGEVIVDGDVLPESGESLAAWKAEQEMSDFSNRNSGRALEKKKLLSDIGIGATRRLSVWDKKYRAAEEYYREHGDLLVPYSYVTEDGIHLGKWISHQRIKRKGTQGPPPTDEQIHKLDAIGMSWDETANRGKRSR